MDIAKVIFVRHGATEWNHSRLAQGQADVPLNDEGRRQAIAAAEALSHYDLDAVYSSDLSRAIDTASRIAEPHGLEVQTDPRFREVDQGEWEGLHVDEIKRRWPDLWGPARHYKARPGGESPQAVRSRALAALKDVIGEHPDGTIVIISHGGTIRWLSAEALGYDDLRSARIRGLGNGAAVEMEARLDGGGLVFDSFSRLDGNTSDLDDPND